MYDGESEVCMLGVWVLDVRKWRIEPSFIGFGKRLSAADL